MSEIEEVLQEKEQEFLRRMKEKRDSLEANSQPDSKRFMLHRGSLGRLEPRLGQYEKHSLLQSKRRRWSNGTGNVSRRGNDRKEGKHDGPRCSEFQ